MLFVKVCMPVSVHKFCILRFSARNAFHKTFLCTKNGKFVLKYTPGVNCRTTENFRKDSELMFGLRITAEICLHDLAIYHLLVKCK